MGRLKLTPLERARLFARCTQGALLQQVGYLSAASGIPEILVGLEREYRRTLCGAAASDWTAEFLHGVTESGGSDLHTVWPRFVQWLLCDQSEGIINSAGPLVRPVIEQTARGCLEFTSYPQFCDLLQQVLSAPGWEVASQEPALVAALAAVLSMYVACRPLDQADAVQSAEHAIDCVRLVLRRRHPAEQESAVAHRQKLLQLITDRKAEAPALAIFRTREAVLPRSSVRIAA